MSQLQHTTPETPTVPSPPVATGGLAGPVPHARRRGSRRLVIGLIIVALVSIGVSLWLGPISRGPSDDLGRFQGEWQVDAYGRGGVVVRVSGDRWTYIADGREQRSYRVMLNPSVKEIELIQLRTDGEPAIYTHGPQSGSPVKMHGVYSVNKDGARVVLRPGVEPRPTSLDDPGDAQTLTLKRTTP